MCVKRSYLQNFSIIRNSPESVWKERPRVCLQVKMSFLSVGMSFIICNAPDGKIRENDMDGACSRQGIEEKCIQNFDRRGKDISCKT